MALLSIGDFARLARLSPKALRRYDERGLLRPGRLIRPRATAGMRRRSWIRLA